MKPGKQNFITRKTFVQQMSLALGALSTEAIFPGGLTAQNFIFNKTKNPREVIILGAGLAGLAAAWELKDAGHKISILEARDRPGGRVSTIRKPFDEGLYAEEGAAGYSESYTRALKYIEALGLERIPMQFPKEPISYHLDGQEFSAVAGEAAEWPFNLTPEEQELGPQGIVQKYIGDHLPEEISDPESWEKPELMELDKTSFDEFMRSRGASEGAVALLKYTQWFASLPEDTSAMSMAVADFGLFMGGAPFVLKDGNDMLPKAMAEKLKDNLHYGVEVKGITEKGSKVVIHTNENEQDYEADYVICTIPAAVLNKINFEPPLSDARRKALAELPNLDVTRTYVQVEKPFWLENNLSGMAYTDLPIRQVQPYSHPEDPKNHPAILESYVGGPLAKKLGKLPEKQVIDQTLRGMEKIFPEVTDNFQKGYVKAWSEDPFALGGPSWPAPGDVGLYLKDLQASHGRVHFAGEYTSILRSTMEGALRSGVKAANAIHHLA